jgi:hypothetical protein
MSDLKPTPRNEAIKMPEALKAKFVFTKPIFGGPVFDFPHLGLTGVNLAELTEQRAELLLKKGWAGIARATAPKAAPLDSVVTAKP